MIIDTIWPRQMQAMILSLVGQDKAKADKWLTTEFLGETFAPIDLYEAYPKKLHDYLLEMQT